MNKILIFLLLFSLNFINSKNKQIQQVSSKIAYLFAHGVGGNKYEKDHLINNLIFPKKYPCFAYNGPEIADDKFDQEYVVLAQDEDIAIVSKYIKYDIEKKFDTCVAFGVSKGASLLINMPKPNYFKALILESPFCDANDVIKNFAKNNYLGWLPEKWSLSITRNFIFKNYDPNGIQPIKCIKNSSPDIAMLFIHSKEDKLIHINHSRKLYKELISQNRKNVYILETESGEHANVFSSNSRLYLNVVHAFYKKLNLPYEERFAKNIDLSQYQPNLEEINKRIDRDNKK